MTAMRAPTSASERRWLSIKLTPRAYSRDAVVTSPPYDNLRNYKGQVKWDCTIWRMVIRGLSGVLVPGGVVVWVVGDATIKGSETGTSFKQALYFKEIGFNF